MSQIRAYIVAAAFRLLPTTRSRAWFLRQLGASIGKSCRIHTIEFLNIESGFARLSIGANCYIGPGVLVDLAGTIRIAEGVAISARAILLSHDDPGSSHNSPLCAIYPPRARTTVIGCSAWLGAGSIVVSGCMIGEQCVLAAGSVARGTLEARSLYAGNPASLKRRFT